jgi:hypothetical protein
MEDAAALTSALHIMGAEILCHVDKSSAYVQVMTVETGEALIAGASNLSFSAITSFDNALLDASSKSRMA